MALAWLGSWEASSAPHVPAWSWWAPLSLPGGRAAWGGMTVPPAAVGSLLQGQRGCPSITSGWVPGSPPAPGTHSSPTAPPGLSADQTTPASTISARSHRLILAKTLSSRGEDVGPRTLTSGNICAAGRQSHHPGPGLPAYLLPYVLLSRDGTNAENMAPPPQPARRGLGAAEASPCPLPAVPPTPGGCRPPPGGCRPPPSLRCCAGWCGGPAVHGS